MSNNGHINEILGVALSLGMLKFYLLTISMRIEYYLIVSNLEVRLL